MLVSIQLREEERCSNREEDDQTIDVDGRMKEKHIGLDGVFCISWTTSIRDILDNEASTIFRLVASGLWLPCCSDRDSAWGIL